MTMSFIYENIYRWLRNELYAAAGDDEEARKEFLFTVDEAVQGLLIETLGWSYESDEADEDDDGGDDDGGDDDGAGIDTLGWSFGSFESDEADEGDDGEDDDLYDEDEFLGPLHPRLGQQGWGKVTA